MTFEEWYEKDKKKKKQVTSKDTSFEEWYSSRFPVSVSAEQEEEDAKKREAYLASRNALTIETTQDIYDKYGKYFYESDFADLSKPTGSKQKDVGWKFWEDKGDDLYDFINDVDNYRTTVKALSAGNGESKEYGGYTGYEGMTQFEIGVYNYLYASKGKDEAQKFLDDLKPALTYRRGAYDAENIQGIENDALRTIMYGAKSIGGGIDSATTGLRNLFSEEDVPTTAMEVTNALLSEDLDGWKKTLYGAGNVVGNQLLFLPFGAAGLALQGASAGGNAYRQALQEGKTKEEARAYGAMVGSMEFLTGKLLSGISGMTGNFTKNALSKVSTLSPLSNAIAKSGVTSKVLSNLAAFSDDLVRAGAKYGISTVNETVEEEMQIFLEPLARQIAFGEEYDAPTREEMAETAIVTMLSTGILNSSTDIATGQFTKVNGLSANEAKVIEAEVNNRVAEAEADGKKLTGKEKEKIRDKVVAEAQRGYISTDTIESVLGGKSYENYKSLAEQKPSLESRKTEIEDEIKELVKTPELQFTVEQRERYDSLREEARGIKEQIKGIETAKTNLFNEVDKLTSKDTLLRESYNEIIRKTQDIDIDENQYNGTKFADAAKKTIENARKANANNSNRVRDFVEFSAKYSSQSGVVVDFRNENQIKQILENQLKSDIAKETDEAKLAELQDTLKQVQEGKIKVNGVKTKNGVAINLESPNYLNAVLGHEVTHFLENTDAYKALQNAVFKYAQTKKDYDGRRKILEILYKNVDGTTVDQELTADLIGDYLFTEYDFIKSLSTENRNVFPKVYDQIKYMFKLATAGSKEARELEKVMHQFEKALRESTEIEADGKTQFSLIGNTKDGRRCYQSEFDDDVSMEDRIEAFKARISTIFNLGAVELKTDVKKIKIKADKFTAQKNIYGDYVNQDGEQAAKINSLYDLADILATSKYDPSATKKEPSYANPALEPKNKAHKDVKYWYKFRNEIVFDGVPYTVTFNIRDKGSEQYQYLIEFKENKTPGLSNTVVNNLLRTDQVSSEDSISPLPKNVNTQFSLSADPKKADADYMFAVKNGDTETAQRMVDEAARNAGYTRTLYHGTASKFNVFGFGRTGIFTTDNYDMAKTYGDNVISLYGKEGAKVLTIDAQESPHYAIRVSKDVLDFSEYPLMRGKELYSTNDISLIAFREGYDVVVINNVYDNYSAVSGNPNGLGTDVVYKDSNQVKSSEAITYDDNGNVIPLSERFNVGNEDIRYSLSNEGEQHKLGGSYRFDGKDFTVKSDIAPVREDIAENATTTETDTNVGSKTVPTAEDVTAEEIPTEEHPIAEEPIVEEVVSEMPPLAETSEDIIKTVKERLSAKITNSTKQLEEAKLLRDWVKASCENEIEKLQATYDSKKNKNTKVAIGLQKRIANLKRLAADRDADLQKHISDIEARIANASERLQEPPKKDILEVRYERIDKHLEADKAALAEDFAKRKAEAQKALADKSSYISNKALELYKELQGLTKGVRASADLGYLLDHGYSWKTIKTALINAKNSPNKMVNFNVENENYAMESITREMLNRSYEDAVYGLDNMDAEYQQEVAKLETEAEKQREAVREEAQALRRADVRNAKLSEVESVLNSKGFSLDSMLDNPNRQLSTLETVDTMPQRVMEKTFGYEEGQALADATVNKIAQNETEGIKWHDSITNRKTGLLAQFVKKYNIKPGSKEIEAAQMYAEGSWVDEETGEEFAYGDAELAKDFPNVEVQNNIKALVKDPRIRQFYDETLDAINEARKRNGYPEIPRRDNYYLHFREMGDFFSKNGLPFNPNDIRAKDLPTDMVGRTADLKPGQPYFTSSMQRKGKKTSYDLYKGIELYANMAKNQIYHIDDIQTLRALHFHIAERFGQAQGLENLNRLNPEQAAEQINKVYDAHLSTFAAFLDTEANILAGKTSMIDRAFSEGMIGRRILALTDALNKQTGAGMVGYGVSSAFTNVLPVVREFAKSNPVDSVKAIGQTVANIASRGKFDTFREDNTVFARRKGADRFNRTLWQKLQDPGYALMGAVDEIGTEIIARTEYNKAIRKGMSEKEAHYEADKKTSRLMADRSLGQMPQMYTSRLLGLVTKFQLEVRNDLDSMFYDTLQEKKLANKDIENALAKNAKTAAQVAWTYGVTAIALHAFGQAFEKVAGYNPAFDIIEAISKAFGWDDDEESEDTLRDNLGQGAMSLLEDLPYASIFLDGGRVPISSALPDFKGIITGKDEYGNEKSLADSFIEIAPYMLPAGGNQIKKTIQGLGMFSDDHPVAGSYTDSGNLRFPVEDTPLNRLQAGLFGQYSSKNAREYFDNDYAPLKEKQIQEYIDVDMPIKDYWEYRKGLSDLAPLPGNESVTLNQKGDYIGGLDLPVSKKNILINNIADRSKPIDFTGYENYSDFEEFDFATRFPEKYAVLKEQGISVADYKANYEETAFLYTDDFSWAANNPEKYTLSKAVTNDVEEYKRYTTELYNIKADKDSNGKSISGSRKEKVLDYINNLDLDYGAKIILFKSEYPSDNTYNYDIIDYLNNHSDLTYEDRVTIYRELGFRVESNGAIYAD